MTESLAYHRRFNLPESHALPLVLKALRISVHLALDLTLPEVLATLAIKLDALTRDPWWLARARNEEAYSQAIGRAAHRCGIEMILLASSHSSSGINAVLLPDHIVPPSQMVILRSGGR